MDLDEHRHQQGRHDSNSDRGHGLEAQPGRRASPTWADDRLGLATLAKKNLRKVFPDHWSFMLGEIALWSFVVLLLSGVFLTLLVRPEHGRGRTTRAPTTQLRGVEMSEAYASTPAAVLRRPRRPADAADAPLGGDALHRLDDDPPAARLLHRRAPQAARAQLGDRLPAAAPRHPRGLHRLLAARRPALRHRHPRRGRLREGAAGRRHLHVVLPLRRRVPRRLASSRGSTPSTCC